MPNPNPTVTLAGYFGYSWSCTVVWLLINIPFIINAFAIYTGEPFKIPFYKNILLDIFLIGNLVPMIVFFFKTASLLKTLGLRALSNNVAGAILGISLGAVAINVILNFIIQKMELYKKALSNLRVMPAN